jgi:1-deoxy-D-xylulose-5-phosphate synthase
MRFIKPLDEELILQLAVSHDYLVTLEENVIAGGAGSAINELLIAHNTQLPILNLGLPDTFVEQGSREECLEFCGLDTAGIATSIESFLDLQVQPAAMSRRAQGKH